MCEKEKTKIWLWYDTHDTNDETKTQIYRFL